MGKRTQISSPGGSSTNRVFRDRGTVGIGDQQTGAATIQGRRPWTADTAALPRAPLGKAAGWFAGRDGVLLTGFGFAGDVVAVDRCPVRRFVGAWAAADPPPEQLVVAVADPDNGARRGWHELAVFRLSWRNAENQRETKKGKNRGVKALHPGSPTRIEHKVGRIGSSGPAETGAGESLATAIPDAPAINSPRL